MSFRENNEHRLSPGNNRALGVAGGISTLRRNTVQLARDAILRRLSRTTDGTSPFRFSFARTRTVTAEELNKVRKLHVLVLSRFVLHLSCFVLHLSHIVLHLSRIVLSLCSSCLAYTSHVLFELFSVT